MRGSTGPWVLLALLLTTAPAQARRAPDLCAAVASGQLGQVRRALRGQARTAPVRCGKVPVLHHGIVKGAPFEVLLALLHAGSDVNQPDPAGDTPLLLAVRLRDVELVKLLFQYGADPARRNAVGLSAIDEAQQSGRSALLEAMGVPVKKAEVDPASERGGARLDASQDREDATAGGEDAGRARDAAIGSDTALATAPAVATGQDPARHDEDAALRGWSSPAVAQEEVESAPAPAAPGLGLGRKLLLFLLVAVGVAVAMRLLLRLAR